jgi:hypothetical protein
MNVIAKLRYAGALVGFALVASSAGIADATNFAGTWTVAGTLGNPVIATSAPVCIFRQGGNAISGTCKGPNGIGSADGSVNGRAIYWRWHIIATNPNGLAGIATYRGVWGSDGVVRGTWTHTARPGVGGIFTAQKL